MREFQGKSGALSRLSPGAKALYASYVGFTLLGFLTSMVMFWQRLGLWPSSAAAWYLGGDDPTRILVEKPTAELLDTTHFHLFTVPVSLLVLGHLFLLSRGGSWKTGVIVAAVVLTLLHVAGPWVVHFGGAGFGWWMPVTGVPFLAVYLVMALWPLPELLRPKTE